MKKKFINILKNNLFGFVIGIILASSIGVYAATTLASSSVAYDNSTSGGSSTNVQGALDELYDKADKSYCPDTSDWTTITFKVGDYVKMTPSSNSYVTSSEMTGADTVHLIPNELNLWRVIRINSDNTVEMVSQYVSNVKVNFKGNVGYQNFVGYLNTLAGLYENNCYTIGSRSMGFSTQTPYIYDTSKIVVSTAPWSTYTSNTVATDEVLGGGDTLYSVDESLVKTAIGNLIAYTPGTTTATSYWIASRYYYYSSSGGVRFYCGRYVDTSGSVVGASNNMMFSYTPGGKTSTNYAYAIRPIVILKSSVKVKSGSGTSSSPYVLS